VAAAFTKVFQPLPAALKDCLALHLLILYGFAGWEQPLLKQWGPNILITVKWEAGELDGSEDRGAGVLPELPPSYARN